MSKSIEARVLYDSRLGTDRAVFLGRVSQICDAAAGLKSAVAEIKRHDGTNLRFLALDETGAVIYTAKVPESA